MGDYIPKKDIEFNIFQENATQIIGEHLEEWGIPIEEFNELMEIKTIWVNAWDKAKNRYTRTAADVVAKKEARKIYEPSLRKFINERIRYNTKISDEYKIKIGLKLRKKPTKRPKIDTPPYVLLSPGPGATLRIRCRVEKDRTRANRHKHADSIEMKYKIGEPPPNTPDDCTNTIIFTKAIHTISLDIAHGGKKIYAFLRWKNNTNDTKSGPWTEMLQTTIIG